MTYAGVAQLVRASACQAEGRGFEPHRPRNRCGRKYAIILSCQRRIQAPLKFPQ